MAFSKNLRVYTLIVIAAFALVACAKRDSDFKARKNALGATDVGGDRSLNADNLAKQMGYDVDVLTIQAPYMHGSGVLAVDSYLKVNATAYKVTTTHAQVGVDSQTSGRFDGADFNIVGRCSNQNCNPYYLVFTITRNGQQIKQTAVKKFFYYTNPDSSSDIFMSIEAGQFMSPSQAMQALDQASAQQGTGSGSTLYTKAQ